MAYRTLAIVYKLVDECPASADEAEAGLALLAVLSIRDSLRRHTARSIASCQQAGTRLVMMTGDDLPTAQTIASECHLLGGDMIALTGAQLRKLLPSQLADVLPRFFHRSPIQSELRL
jgi:Ca2+-transporting ATPase